MSTASSEGRRAYLGRTFQPRGRRRGAGADGGDLQAGEVRERHSALAPETEETLSVPDQRGTLKRGSVKDLSWQLRAVDYESLP